MQRLSLRAAGKPLLEELQTLSAGLGETDFPLRSSRDEHLIVAGHPPVVVAVAFTDLEEGSSGDLTTVLVKVFENRQHHASPSVAGIELRAEGQAQAFGLLARGQQQSLDAFQAAFR